MFNLKERDYSFIIDIISFLRIILLFFSSFYTLYSTFETEFLKDAHYFFIDEKHIFHNNGFWLGFIDKVVSTSAILK